jgi:hypothetical protein
MVMIFRFTGTVRNNEYVLDMDALYGIDILRDTSYADLKFEVTGGKYSDSSFYFNSGKVVQNSWHTVKFWYIASTLEILFQINDLSIMGGWTVSTIPDMSTLVYLSTSSTSYAFNGNIAGFFFVDEYISDEAMTAIAAAMTAGVDLTDTTCPSGNACTACDAAKYKSTSGTASCTACPAGLTSPVGSTSSVACIVAACNAGYTGPDGGVCAPCAAGSYKSTTGSAACTSCGAGTYSTTAAATSAAACLACPANSGASCSGCSASACPCNSGYISNVNFIVQYSSTACARFVALILSTPRFASVSTRNNAAVGSSPLPTYNALGGPNGNGHVSFDRALLQYLDAGARTFNTATNGGFTIVTVLRFSGTSIKTENILEIPERVSLFTSSRTSIRLFLGDALGSTTGSVDATVSPGTNWIYIACTYSSVTNVMNLLIDNVNQGTSTTLGLHVPDITLSNMYIGKQDATVPSFNGDMAGLFVVDELLSSSAIAEIYSNMLQGVDLTQTPCSGGTCTACVAGKYQINTSSTVCTPCAAGTYSATPAATSAAACLACPANSNSPEGSTAAASCACNAGFALSDNVCVCDLGYEPGA